MSTIMLRQSLKELRWTFLWYAAGLFAYALVIVAFYPTIRTNMAQFQDMLNTYPQVFLRAFGITDFTTFTGFISAEFLSVIWPLIMAAFAITVGAASVAQEIERGTIDLWLSAPESRARLLLAKGVALFGSLIALVWVTLSGLAIGAYLIEERLSVAGLVAAGVTASAFALSIGSAAMLCSSFTSDRGKAAGLAAGLALVSYLLWVSAGLSDRWHWLSRLSVFTAYQPQTALTSGRIPGWETLALLAVTLACTIAALALFQRRNMIA